MSAFDDALAACQTLGDKLAAVGAPAALVSPIRAWLDANAPVPVVSMRQLNLTRIVCLVPQYQGFDRYVRAGEFWYVTKPGKVDFCAANIAAGGTSLTFQYPTYALLFNGVERARCSPGAVHRGTFNFTLGNEQGHTLAEIVAYDASGARVASPAECYPRFWFVVDQDGSAKKLASVMRQYGSFEWVHPETATPSLAAQPGMEAFVEVPLAMAEPAPAPLAPRNLQPIPAAAAAKLLYRTPIIPARDEDHCSLYRTVWNRAGVPSAANLQAYYPEDANLQDNPFPAPRLSMIDGPRGVAMMPPATAIVHGFMGRAWACHAWGIVQVSPAGAIKTVIGLRHKRARYSGHDGLPDYYEPPTFPDPNVENVHGDCWPAGTPANQCFPLEAWNLTFDKRYVAVDPSRPLLPIVVDGQTVMMAQHVGMPTLIQVDRLGRLIRYRFHGNTDNLPAGYSVDARGYPVDAAGNYVDLHDLPPVIDFLVTGLSDPWGCVCVNGVVYVTERGRSAISMWNADTGAALGDLIANPNFSRFGSSLVANRRRFKYAANFSYNDVVSGKAAAATRVDPIGAPEGLDAWTDSAGDLWLYWGSYAMGEVRRINVRTKQVQVVCRPFVGWEAKSWYVYVRVCKGGPNDGVVGTTTWSEAATSAGGFGRPEFWLPVAGAATDGTALTNSKPWAWAAATTCHVLRGPGGRTSSCGYASAFDIAPDRITCASSQAGLDEFTLADPAAPLPDEARCARGFAWWKARGGPLFDGTQYPIPTGQNADFDYWNASYRGR